MRLVLVGLAHLSDEGGFDILSRVQFFDPVEGFQGGFCEELPGVYSLSPAELGDAY